MDLSQPFQLITFVVTLLTVILQVYVIFLIAYVSPRSMATYRWYLIASTVFEMLYTFDFGIFILNEPPDFFPGAGTFVRGLVGHMGELSIRLASSASYFFAAFMIGSQNICLIYRFLAVHPNKQLCQQFTSLKWTLFSYGLVFLLSLCVALAAFWVIAPASEHKTIIDAWTMKSLGHTTEIDFETPRLLLYNNKPDVNYFFGFVGTGLAVSEAVYLFVVFKILRVLHQNSSSFSRRSIRLHRQLTILLAAQVLVPLIMFIGPYGLLLIRMKTQTTNSKFDTQVGLVFFNCHFTVLSIMTITFVTPYRRFVLEKIQCIMHPNKRQTPVTKTIISSITY